MRLERDAHPVGFLLHMLRLPGGPYWGINVPVMDSLFHSVWLQLWKRDAVLGLHGRGSAQLGDVYLTVFFVASVVGTWLFVADRRGRSRAWTQLGWILLVIGGVLLAFLVRLGYEYPVWDWRIFKAKYIAPALLWIPFTSALVVDYSDRRLDLEGPRFSYAVLTCVAGFMVFNHLLPVY